MAQQLTQLALQGLRILDCTEEVAGPYCSLLLAGLGAEVMKIEPPQGDSARHLPPFARDRRDRETSLIFLHLNRAKHSLVLDPTTEESRAVFRRLANTADALLVDGDAQRALALWQVSREELRQARPTLVITSLTPFGEAGPWRDWVGTELILSAASGLASCTGEAERSPLKVGGHPCSLAQGQTAAAATLAAVWDARRRGVGSDVEASGAEANADLLENWALGIYQGRPMPRLGRQHNSSYPFEVYPCRGGLVGVHTRPGLWQDFAALLEAPELGDPELAEPEGRMRFRERIDAYILRWLSGRDKLEAYHAGQAKRFAFGYVATPEDLVRSAHLKAREFFHAIQHPVVPDAIYPGPPFRLRSGWQDGPAPLLDQHREEILRFTAPENDWQVSEQPAPSPDPILPLAGVRMLDLSQIWAGPRATKILADYGAEVIKIESRHRTDRSRGYQRFLKEQAAGRIASEREHNRRTQFEQLHRGQQSITLDLRSALGRRAFLQLAAVSDVVIANFAYGVLARLGVDWQDLEPVNPRLILLSMTGFGDSGPERDYVAYGVTQEELSGIYSLTGYEGEGPLKSGSNIGDPMNGLHGVVAILAALHERDRTGRGQYIEFSQNESSIGFIGDLVLDYVVNGRMAQPTGNAHPLWAPHGIYPARGEDQWVAIAARNEDDWQRVLAVLGADDLGREARFQSLADRLTHRADLDRELARWTVAWERQELAVALQAQGVPAAPVLTSLEVQYHPHYEARGFLPTLTHPDGGQYRYFGPLWRINGMRPPIQRPAPLLGEHTAEVLRTLTDLTPEEIATLGD
jgi:crotonobetainyl-CoA:carnitine CoA-transferase CaiB-like acyl-CoA transferase